jgi:ubiquinone/menaquinone biosynthesis C-methylase UbiE
MSIRHPKSWTDLRIGKKEYVLEVGGGHAPHPRANVVCDKFIDTNYHRSGDIKVLKNQKFLQADGENLPFKDKEFDYVICEQVLEHVDNPAKFLQEQMRVAKRGYLEAPSILGEYLYPKESHKWVILEINEKIVLVEKSKVFRSTSFDIGDIYLHHLPAISIPFKLLMRTQPNLFNIAIEWTDTFEYLVEPTEPEYLKYFTEYWTTDMINSQVKANTKAKELVSTIQVFTKLFSDVFVNTFSRIK